MNIGRRIYYDKSTGEVLLNTGERSGNVVETTIDQDFSTYTALLDRSRDSVGVIQLEYGEYSSDFTEGGIVSRINLETLKPLFTYPDPSQPEVPTDPQKPLSEEIKEVKERQDIMQDALDALLMGGM
ncbi:MULTISPECIES: hypothetical protein [unclassified Paenibacillus]|uniref:hypothetical protein n=1 Tax=unclassified Paenibacillus TaxID=185978 RepID=UPI0009A8C340|nr:MULTISPECIES: hypothetical protein [unclassified Paenibacillus]SLJ98092.1 hypothetical protein SAMN06272722_102695 [Paenibacillus sp. RU5A]SOC66820.1 hypothetical protein SAMN05880581_102302 [Paenibacillus sp. RU26A]SOC70031.1 hypothetical protein SAMN05880586_102695 [Paenibacillus sp. RU5M]